MRLKLLLRLKHLRKFGLYVFLLQCVFATSLRANGVDGNEFSEVIENNKEDITITGRVSDESGVGLPGATIIVAGTTNGATTDLDGMYKLTVPENASITISYVGYLTKNISVGSKSVINIQLQPDAEQLEEVIVVGYGTQKKSSLTGAIAKVENTNLDQQPVGRTEMALLGQLPGLSIRQTKAGPGETPDISIRGTSSITGNNAPLVVIDGFPGGDLSTINTGDIESIEVLKDASSAAIYGSRAAGGVIIVTTKTGKGKTPVFTFNSYFALKKPAYLYDDVLNSEEAYQYDLRRVDVDWIQDGGDPNVPIEDRPEDYQPDEVRRTFADTDWQDEMLKDAIIQNYELSARGSTDALNYYISGNFLDEESTFIVGQFKRYSLRANLTTNFSKKFKLGLNLYGANTYQRKNNQRMREPIKYPTSVPIYLPEGETALGGNYAYNRYYFDNQTSGVNPVAKSLGEIDEYKRFITQANLFLQYKIIDGLAFKTSLGIKYNNNKNPYFRTTWGDKSGLTAANYQYSDRLNVLNENLLTYDKTIGTKHEINALLGASFQKESQFESYTEVTEGSIPDNQVQTLNVGIVSVATTNEEEWGLISYFGRINYSFNNKYLISAVYRMDGSSRFGSDTKWGAFPSASVGWNMHEENFLKGVSMISNLKLRASYGVTGRTPDENYLPMARVQSFNYTLGGSVVNGSTQGTFGNNELGWERTVETNLGVDLGLFGGRLGVTADVYQRKTSDLLLQTPIPAITGFESTTANVGEVSNKGIELAVHGRISAGDFQWNSKVNYSRNINEVVDLGDLNRLPLSQAEKGMWFQTKVGQPIGQYFGWVQQGIWNNQEEINSNASSPGATPGSIRIKDMNGDGEIDADDRAPLGSYMPDFEIGFVNDFKYKNFDLSVLMYGVFGFEIYNYELNYYRHTRKMWTENRWYSPQETGDGQTPGNEKGTDLGSTDYYIEDASYWGIRNINLGFTFPQEWVGKVFSSARMYVSVQNAALFTTSDFNAYNPEGFTDNEGNLTQRGVNYGSEPLNRTYSIGFNLTF